MTNEQVVAKVEAIQESIKLSVVQLSNICKAMNSRQRLIEDALSCAIGAGMSFSNQLEEALRAAKGETSLLMQLQKSIPYVTGKPSHGLKLVDGDDDGGAV